MKKPAPMKPADVIEDGSVTTAEGAAYEEQQKEVLRLADEARKILAKSRAEERTAPVSDSRAAKRQGELEDRLARLSDAISVAKVNRATAEKAETLAAKQREVDAASLRAEEERLKQEATAVQLELERLEAVALADAVAQEQAVAPRPELADAAVWREMLKADMEPMITAAVNTIVKLKSLLAERGPILDKISSLRPDDTMLPDLWHQYQGIAHKAREVRALIAQTIDDTQRVLNRAAKFVPAYFTEETGRLAHMLQRDLERVSGVVVRPRAFRDTRAGMKATTATEPPVVVAGYVQAVDDLLASYRSVQKLADEAKGQPREVVIRLEPKSPYWEARRRRKVGEALHGTPEQEKPNNPLADLGLDKNTWLDRS